jgi:general secretion pathway protein B
MSLILDALKKLEREKSARKARLENIALEILKPDLPRPQKRIPLHFVALSLTAAAAAAITYFSIAGFGYLSKSSPPAPVKPPAPSEQAASAPQEPSAPPKSPPPAPAILPAPSHQAAPAPLEPSSLSKSSPPAPATPTGPSPGGSTVRSGRRALYANQDEMSRVPPKIQTQAESRSPVTSMGEEEVGQNAIPQETYVAPAVTKKPAEHTPGKSPTTPPSLRLSGILWHEDPSERRVVINGMVLTEGAVTEGVKVLEIHPTHVRLSHNGRPFEISMSR